MRLLAWAALAVAFFVSGPAVAQPMCNTRERVLEQLADRYGEQVIASGVNDAGALLEILATPDGATWTVIVTAPGGPTCLVSAGEGWRWRGPKQEDPKA